MRYYSRICFGILLLLLSGCVCRIGDIQQLRRQNLQSEYHCFYPECEDCIKELSLDEVISIAHNRNLDLLVKERELAIQKATELRDVLRLLPSLTYDGELSRRSNNTGSSSQSLLPGVPPAPPSISSEQHTARHELVFTWNLLDFGISYYRARQEANRTLMFALEYQKVEQDLILDIVKQYWKAVVSRHGMRKAEEILAKAQESKELFTKQIEAKILSKLDGLTTKNLLIDIEIQLNNYKRAYYDAKIALALHMDLHPSANFDVKEIDEFPILEDLADPCQLEEIALTHRPELYVRDVDEKIALDEVRASLLESLPGISLFTGSYYNDNKFLIHNFWQKTGIEAARNLLSLPFNYRNSIVAKGKKMHVRQQRIAVSVGVISQVHLAHLMYQDNLRNYNLYKELYGVKEELFDVAKNLYEEGEYHIVEALHYRSDALLAEIQSLRAYGELQISLEHLNNSLGVPRYFRSDVGGGLLSCDVGDGLLNRED